MLIKFNNQHILWAMKPRTRAAQRGIETYSSKRTDRSAGGAFDFFTRRRRGSGKRPFRAPSPCR